MLGEPSRSDPLGEAGIELVRELAQKVVDSLDVSETIVLLRKKMMDQLVIPPSRETSLALTKLDECEMWLRAANQAQKRNATS